MVPHSATRRRRFVLLPSSLAPPPPRMLSAMEALSVPRPPLPSASHSLSPSSSPFFLHIVPLPLRPPLSPPQKIAHLSIQANKLQSPPHFVSSIQRLTTRVSNLPALRNAAFLAINALATALPAVAGEEKGKIFDFNLTLPIMGAQFLLLMVALDNLWFKPVAKVMDERDETIRQKLLGVRDNSGEIKKLQEDAEAIIKAARAETTLALNQMKRETAAALDEKLQESRERIEKELAAALANLEVQKEETLKSLDKQVQELSEEIVRKVIPFEV